MVYFVLVGMFLMNVYCAASLGIQWLAGLVGTIVMWAVAMPCIVIFAVWQGGGIETAWLMLLPTYTFMNLFLVYQYVVFDWDSFGEGVRKREEAGRAETVMADEASSSDDTNNEIVPTEATPLVMV